MNAVAAVPLRERLAAIGATPNGALVLAFITWTLASMDQSLFGYAVPGMMAEFGIGLEVVGVMISASFVAGMLTPPVGGVLTDLWGPRRVLAACLLLSSLLVYAQSHASSALMLGGLRVLSYGFSAALSPITSALVANTAPPRLRAPYVAILQCAYPLGWAIAALAFVPLAGGDNAGWRVPFSVALAVVPFAVQVYFLLPDRAGLAAGAGAGASAGAAPRSPVAELFGPRNRRTALYAGLTFFLYGGAVGGSAFYLPTFFQAQRGYSPADASLIVGLTYGIATIGYLASAFLSRTRFGARRTTILWSGVGAVLFGICVWLPPVFASDVVAFGITAMFFFGTSSILTTYMLDVFDARIRATAIAICGSTCLTAGFIVFPMLTARAVAAWGWQWAFTVVVVSAALGACAVVSRLPEVEESAS